MRSGQCICSHDDLTMVRRMSGVDPLAAKHGTCVQCGFAAAQRRRWAALPTPEAPRAAPSARMERSRACAVRSAAPVTSAQEARRRGLHHYRTGRRAQTRAASLAGAKRVILKSPHGRARSRAQARQVGVRVSAARADLNADDVFRMPRAARIRPLSSSRARHSLAHSAARLSLQRCATWVSAGQSAAAAQTDTARRRRREAASANAPWRREQPSAQPSWRSGSCPRSPALA